MASYHGFQGQHEIENLDPHRDGVDRPETDDRGVQHVCHLRHPDAWVYGQEAQAHQASNRHCEKVNSINIFPL